MKMDDVLKRLNADNETSARIVGCIDRLSREFATPDAFFLASKGELMKAYLRITPESKRGLGEKFFSAMAKAVRLWNTPEEDRPVAPDVTYRDPRLDEILTVNEVLLIAELMEKFKKAEVSVDWILAQVRLARA